MSNTFSSLTLFATFAFNSPRNLFDGSIVVVAWLEAGRCEDFPAGG